MAWAGTLPGSVAGCGSSVSFNMRRWCLALSGSRPTMSICLPRFSQPLSASVGAAAGQGRGGDFSVGRRLSRWTRACSYAALMRVICSGVPPLSGW